MRTLASRFISSVAGIAFIGVSSLASAQVTLNLSSGSQQQTDCVVTTDANGLTLVPGSSDLQATGVTYSGAGCGTGGTGGNFNAQLSIQQPNPVAGSATNVIWSAGQSATQCVYAGSAPAGATLNGWPFGTTACQGAACATSHTTSVTPSAAGNYAVSVVCTNSTGVAQGSLTASTPATPPQPADFALTAPANATVGTPFTVSWSVSGATSCTGAATVSGNAVTLPGWTNATLPITPPESASVTATDAGTNSLTMTCSNAAGTIHSQAATVVVSQAGGTACVGPGGITRQTSGTVTYPNGRGTATRDFTSFSKIWGHAYGNNPPVSDPELPWPGTHGASPILTINRSQFVAAQFTVPQNALTSLSGFIQHQTYSYGVDMTAAYSTTCGDFNPPNPSCVVVGTGPNTAFPFWQTAQGNGCVLTPGTTYYLNLKPTNPNQATSTCAAGSPTCPMATTNYFGGDD